MSLRHRLLRPVLHSLAHRGPGTTLRSLLAPALHLLPPSLRPAAPPLDPYPAATPSVTHPFDIAHAVDTSGYLRGDQLHTPAHQPLPLHGPALWSTAYYAIAPSIFDRALALAETAIRNRSPDQNQSQNAPASAAPLAHTAPTSPFADLAFVDLGCGKGRALLLASRHPFLQILGLELDPTLARIARQNLRTFTAPWQQCHHLTALHADATAVTLPLTPILLFLYNPFLAPVLRRVLDRLERSLRQHPRELWLLYINPEAAHALAHHPRFVEHTRLLLHVSPEDALADRLGVNTEEVALYHYHRP